MLDSQILELATTKTISRFRDGTYFLDEKNNVCCSICLDCGQPMSQGEPCEDCVGHN